MYNPLRPYTHYRKRQTRYANLPIIVAGVRPVLQNEVLYDENFSDTCTLLFYNNNKFNTKIYNAHMWSSIKHNYSYMHSLFSKYVAQYCYAQFS